MNSLDVSSSNEYSTKYMETSEEKLNNDLEA